MDAGRLSRLARPAAVEAAFLVVVLILFTRVHAALGTDAAAATEHARALRSVEQALHLDVELGMNRWLSAHPALAQVAVYYYRLYYLAIAATVVWVWLRRPEVYVRVRRVLVAMVLLVLPVFWALPMAPPRFAVPGVVDVVAASWPAAGGGNVYSAFPSMHVGWSLWCGYAVWSALRGSHPRAAWPAWLFPLGMMAVVLTTGNHYVLDIAGSLTLLAVSVGVAAVCGRLRSGNAGAPRPVPTAPPARPPGP